MWCAYKLMFSIRLLFSKEKGSQTNPLRSFGVLFLEIFLGQRRVFQISKRSLSKLWNLHFWTEAILNKKLDGKPHTESTNRLIHHVQCKLMSTQDSLSTNSTRICYEPLWSIVSTMRKGLVAWISPCSDARLKILY